MTSRRLTELQEQSRNAAHTSAIIHKADMNGWNQLDHGRRWIVAREGLWPEIDDRRWIPAADGLWHDMDRDQIDDRGG